MKAEITIIDKSGNRFMGVVELAPVKCSKQQPVAPIPEKRTGRKSTLRDHVLKLRDSGFFSKPKTAKEVHTKVQEFYHCDLNRVEVVLTKLRNIRKLRKAAKKENNKTKAASVW